MSDQSQAGSLFKTDSAANSVGREMEVRKLGFLQIVVFVLSIFVLCALLVQTFFPLPAAAAALFDRIDFFICFVFLAEFFVGLYRAPSKLGFLKWGWIDLISSIPMLDTLRWGRMLRVIRIFRLLRVFRSTKHLLAFLYRDRAKATAGTAALAALLLVIVTSIAILLFEDDPASTIKTPFDAIWWSVSTITTVGYGDKIPVTPEGKIVAMLLMLAGIGLFGVLTGLFARLLVQPEFRTEERELAELTNEIRLLRKRIEQMEGSRGHTQGDTAGGR